MSSPPRSRLVVALLISISLLTTALPASAHAAVVSKSGDMRAYLLDFVAGIPGRGSEGYDKPSAGEASAMASAYRLLAAGDVTSAASKAKPYRYDVVRYADSISGRRFDMLVERTRDNGTYAHAWGLYVRTPATTSALTVEVPHPRFDLRSPEVGIDEYMRAGGADLFISGAHRYANDDGSADVAHRSDSVFEAVHRTVLASGRRIVQPHGFADDPAFGDIVVSAGSTTPTPLVIRLADALTAATFTVCVFDVDHCQGLGGTTNVQGQSTRAAGADFVHLELSRTLRDSAASRDRVVTAITPILR